MDLFYTNASLSVDVRPLLSQLDVVVHRTIVIGCSMHCQHCDMHAYMAA